MNFFLGLKLSKKNTRMGYNTFEGCININKFQKLLTCFKKSEDVEFGKRLNIIEESIKLYGRRIYFHDDNQFVKLKQKILCNL